MLAAVAGAWYFQRAAEIVSAVLCPLLEGLVQRPEPRLGAGEGFTGKGSEEAAEGLALLQPGTAVCRGQREAGSPLMMPGRLATHLSSAAGSATVIFGLTVIRRPLAGWTLRSAILFPTAPGPNGLRYLDHFLGLLAGSGLDTGAKLEVIAIISGFATMYGAMQRDASSPPR